MGDGRVHGAWCTVQGRQHTHICGVAINSTYLDGLAEAHLVCDEGPAAMPQRKHDALPLELKELGREFRWQQL